MFYTTEFYIKSYTIAKFIFPEHKMMYKIIFGFWTLVIVFLCSLPGKDVPNLGLMQQDKIGHFAVFFIWALLFLTWYPHWKKVLFWGIAFGFGIEVYQHYLPFERQMDFWDGVADTIGTVLGIAAFYLYQKRK